MRYLFGLCVLCLTVAASEACGEDPTEAEKAARDFAFEKTKLGTSLTDFKKRFPTAELIKENSDPKLKLACYMADANSATFCGYYFLDDKLYEMRIGYVARTVNKLGGWEVLLEKLVEKFGKLKDGDYEVKSDPLKVSGIWRFPKVDRAVSIEASPKFVGIEVTDLALLKEVQQRKKKAAKTGFDD